MNTGVKALIVVCVVLIAGIGVTAGMLLQKSQGSALATQINSTNNGNLSTNSINNSTSQITNNTTTHTPKTNYIGKAAAKQKAIQFLTERGSMDTTEIKSVDFVTINGVPLYRVQTYDHYITFQGTEAGWDDLYIGAKDGRIYDDQGELVTT